MKKLFSLTAIFTLILKVFTFAVEHPKTTLTASSIVACSSARAQGFFTQGGNISDTSWTVYETGALPHGQRYEPIFLNRISVRFRSRDIYFDTAATKESGNPTGKILWINSQGKLSQSSMSTIQFPYSQLSGAPSLATVAISGSYNDLSNKPSIPTYTNLNQFVNGPNYLTTEVDGSVTNEIELPAQAGNSGKYLTTNGSTPSWVTAPTSTLTAITGSAGIAINSGSVILNTAPDQVVSLTAGSGLVVSGSYPNFTVSLAVPGTTVNASRSVTTNTANNTTGSFSVSTKPFNAVYTVSCTATNPLVIGSSTCSVYLEWSTNGGTSWTSVQQNGNSSAVGVAVAIQLTNGQVGTLISPTLPGNTLLRIRYITSGTSSVVYIGGWESSY